MIESYRNLEGRICHRTMLSAGYLDDLSSDQLNQIQKRINQKVEGLPENIFPEETDPVVISYIDEFYERLKKEKRIDVGTTGKRNRQWETIDLNSLKTKDVRELGAEWLCYQAIKQLKIDNFLQTRGWDEEQIKLAITHLISRAVYPASELKTSHWIKENSAVCEITGYDINKITKDRLYFISQALYAEKDLLEQYLSRMTNELFDLHDRIILYDLTNTYFEGEKRQSRQARFGRSKEKRSDARLVVLAVVINPEGFLKYSTVYEGNKADCKTMGDMIDKLRHATSAENKALVVIDAGLSTESNLKMIREKGYDYLSVSHSGLKNYIIEPGDNILTITDKKKQKIELCKVRNPQGIDYYVKVKSDAKRIKETSMNSRFKDRFEEGLRKIECSIHKKGGVKQLDKVFERIGRLKQKYPSIHRFYDIDVQSNGKNVATSIQWDINPKTDVDQDSGVYFLRTSLDNIDENILWMIYNTIREIEYTFRVLKTDLDLRPIYHQNDESSSAHLHLGLMAYTIVNTIRYQLKHENIRSSWSEIVRIMNTQKCVTTIAQNKQDELIIIRKSSEPNPKVQQIYNALKYKSVPFSKRKSVVLKTEIKCSFQPMNKTVIRI